MRDKLSYTQTGTPYYASPEVWRDKPYDFKSDIWSLGVIIYEVAALIVPFKAETIDELYKKVCRGVFTPLDSKSQSYSSELSNLINSMLSIDPAKRPTCNDILSMPYVQKMMHRLGFISDQEIKEGLLSYPNRPFKPSVVQQILTPYNQTLLQQRLPDQAYNNSSSPENSLSSGTTGPSNSSLLQQTFDFVGQATSNIRPYPFTKSTLAHTGRSILKSPAVQR